MRTVWKVLLGLAVTLPVASYVAGALTASQAEFPVERAPIVVRDASSAPSTGPTPQARRTRTTPPAARPSTDRPRSGNDVQRERGRDDARDEVQVVTPRPDDVDLDDDDAGRDDDERDTEDGDDDD